MSADKKQTLLQQCVDFSEMLFGKNNWNIPLNFFGMVCYFFLSRHFFHSLKILWRIISNQKGASQLSQFVKHCFIRNIRSFHFHCAPEQNLPISSWRW